MRHPGPIAAFALAAVAVAGCRAGESPTRPSAPPASASATPPAPPRAAVPPTPATPVTFGTKDGAALAGDLYLAADHSAPALVLVHRRYRDRSEWKPLVDALRTADKRYTVLAFDLRGEGASKLPPKQHADTAPAHMRDDVRAAIDKVLDATGHQTRGIVLAGSSLGAALVAQVAFAEPKVVALALISPGMNIAGQDGLHPYADVRDLPTFLAGAVDDNVARQPLAILDKMARSKTLQRYPGTAHGADNLGASDAALWSDLESWLMNVYDEKPRPRVPAFRKSGTKEARR